MRLLLLLVPLFLMAANIQWEKDFYTAWNRAKKEHKVLMVFYESHHCPWCKKMLATTLKDPKVLQRLNDLVAVRVFKEDGDFPKRIYSKYTPTTFFFAPDLQNIIRPVLGYQNSEYFLSYLDDVDRRKSHFIKK